MKKISLQFGQVLVSLAEVVSIATVNSTCPFLCYQPKLTEALKKLKRN